MTGSIINDLIEAACHLSGRRSESKEIIVASLNLLKVLCTIFQSSVLAQHLDKICLVVHGLHEKRSGGAEGTASTTAAINKSQRVKSLVKLVLKKLMKKFTYELIVEKLFGSGNETTTPLSGVVRHGLENLLVNLKKLIDKDRLRKMDEQYGAKKKPSNNEAADLISVYTAATADRNAPKSVVLNE